MIIGAIIQARMGSSRLPGKVMMSLADRPLLFHVVERIKYSKKISSIILATSSKKQDEPLVKLAKSLGITSYVGSELDVLKRYYCAASSNSFDLIVRICADCPLVDPIEIDKMVELHMNSSCDYTDNKHDEGPPIGIGAEIISYPALEKAHKESKDYYYREHVTTYIKDNPDLFKICHLDAPVNKVNNRLRLVVDYPQDYELMKRIYNNFYKDNDIIDVSEVIAYLEDNKKVSEINSDLL